MRAAIVLLLIARAAGAQTGKWSWMLDYRDLGENRLAWDKRFPALLRDELPSMPLPGWSNRPVNAAAMDFLGGVPGMLEVRHGRYLAASGCPAHACVARALLWVDTQAGQMVLVVTADEQANADRATRDAYPIGSTKLFIAAKAPMEPGQLPDELRGAIVRWLHLEGVLTVTGASLLTSSGSRPVTTDQLCWTGLCALTRWN